MTTLTDQRFIEKIFEEFALFTWSSVCLFIRLITKFCFFLFAMQNEVQNIRLMFDGHCSHFDLGSSFNLEGKDVETTGFLSITHFNFSWDRVVLQKCKRIDKKRNRKHNEHKKCRKEGQIAEFVLFEANTSTRQQMLCVN